MSHVQLKGSPLIPGDAKIVSIATLEKILLALDSSLPTERKSNDFALHNDARNRLREILGKSSQGSSGSDQDRPAVRLQLQV